MATICLSGQEYRTCPQFWRNLKRRISKAISLSSTSTTGKNPFPKSPNASALFVGLGLQKVGESESLLFCRDLLVFGKLTNSGKAAVLFYLGRQIGGFGVFGFSFGTERERLAKCRQGAGGVAK